LGNEIETSCKRCDKNPAIVAAAIDVAAVHVAAVAVLVAVAVGIVVAACSLTLAVIVLAVRNYGHYFYCSRLTTKSTCCGASNSNWRSESINNREGGSTNGYRIHRTYPITPGPQGDQVRLYDRHLSGDNTDSNRITTN